MEGSKMLTELERASAAIREAAERLPRTLSPALSRCPACAKVGVITAPALGTCPSCQVALVLDSERAVPNAAA